VRDEAFSFTTYFLFGLCVDLLYELFLIAHENGVELGEKRVTASLNA
jgi:hypothetical protein